ncbi:MAG: FecR domain-containing protein, partial [Abitibacteriaceae bacterium]|nr:FecR domain-containing protein [Abditibacteriaceae bacterium]
MRFLVAQLVKIFRLLMFNHFTTLLPPRSIAARLGQVALLAALVMGWQMAPVRAQVARVAALERVTERKVGADAPWRQAHNGDALNVNDRFRTGKRSKADLKFTDGSLLRLGQLSSVEIRSAKGVTLMGGQLLYAALKPGRVLAGAATAEIKGSVAIVTMNPDDSAEFSLFSGAMDVVAPKGTVPLPPGHWVTAFPDGSLSEIRVAPPLEFAFGSFLPDLTEQPSDSPFVGSDANVRLRAAPQRLGLEQYSPTTERNGAIPTKSSSTSGPMDQLKARPITSSNLRRADTATANNGQLATQSADDGAATAQALNTQLVNDLNTAPANQHIGAVDQGMGH